MRCRSGVGGGRYPLDTKNVESIMSSPHEGTQANTEVGFDFNITINTKTLGGSDQGLGQALERKWVFGKSPKRLFFERWKQKVFMR